MPFRNLASLMLCVVVSTAALAQSPRRGPTQRSFDRVELFDSADDPATSRRSRPSKAEMPSASQLRQQRAMFQARQRMLRHQRNLWMGYEPLRPQWNGVPSMSSVHRPPTIFIPVYVTR